MPLRDQLVEQLPREIAAARGLTRDQCELVIDEAIDYMVTEYVRPIEDRASLDRAFWATASFRVKRMHEGRGATVRAGWRRVDVDDLDLAANDLEPESAVVDRIERETLLEFTATLTPPERDVLACKYHGQRELGRILIAQRLGMLTSDVRRAERSIARKLERFAAILAAGSLCDHRQAAIHALAEGASAGAHEEAARMHLRHCTACRVAYSTHLHAIRTGELQRRIGQLIPVPAGAEAMERRRGAPWEAVWDWLARPFAHESTVSLTQVGAASRGLGAVVTAKVAALCLAGSAAVGGGLYCVSQLTDRPPAPVISTSPRGHQAPARETLPTAGRSAAMRRAAASSPARLKKRGSGTAFANGPASTRHEREAPISPAVTTADGGSVPEFGPAPANTAPVQAAAAPASGAPEFP